MKELIVSFLNAITVVPKFYVLFCDKVRSSCQKMMNSRTRLKGLPTVDACKQFGRSVTYNENSNGPSREPCGTPETTC